jgi:hypothetical protein
MLLHTFPASEGGAVVVYAGRHERRYICWKLEVGQLPGNGQRVASSQCLRLRHRRLYLVAEHMGDAGGASSAQLWHDCAVLTVVLNPQATVLLLWVQEDAACMMASHAVQFNKCGTCDMQCASRRRLCV